MHDGAVRPRAGDGREGNILELAGVAAEAFQRCHGVDFGRACRSAPRVSNQARKRVTATPSRVCARALPAISAWFLTAFISVIGSAPRSGLPPCAAMRLRKRIGRAGLVEPHGLALERGEIARELVRRAHVGNLFERVAYWHCRAWRCRHRARACPRVGISRESERQRRMRDIGAANIEGPGDVLRIGHHQRVGAQLRSSARIALELVGGAFAGELDVAQRSPRRPAGRAVVPQRVDRIAVDATSSAPAAAQALLSLSSIVGGVQPRIVAESWRRS